MARTMQLRVRRLENFRERVDEVTLEELVIYSYWPDHERDLDFEKRLEASVLGRLLRDTIRQAEQRRLH